MLASAFSATAEFVTTPEQFGAVGDGKANDWVPLQRAISACAEHNPCRVLLAKSYLSGPLLLNSSGLTLDVAGALAMLPLVNTIDSF